MAEISKQQQATAKQTSRLFRFNGTWCMALAAAANASSHASTSALSVAARDAPASPFAQLLRQSRFATYDPAIRKTYYSPKQFVERGYWGLKRPITQRKKNSFVTIKQWEARQHYVEWDKAEDEVRFIRRIEELNVRPGALANTKWSATLGPAKNVFLVDSEFCPHEWDPQLKENAESPKDLSLDSVGTKGPGGYGKRAMSSASRAGMPGAPSAVIPNVLAMAPAQFERYLAKLRTLRPAFVEYIQREADRQKAEKDRREALQAALGSSADLSPPGDDSLVGKTIVEVAQLPHSSYHRAFLAQRTEAEYKTTNTIQPQPHRNGALLYSHPSPLDTFYRTKSKPGIVLQGIGNTGRFTQEHDRKTEYIAAFAGLTATLSKQEAEGKVPLMSPGIERENWPKAVAEMRPISSGKNKSAMMLFNVPRVVGQDAEGLNSVRLTLQVTARPGFDDMRRSNPYFPGSRLYIAQEGLEERRDAAKNTPRNLARGTPAIPISTPPSSTAFSRSLQKAPQDAPQDRRSSFRARTGSLQNAPKELPSVLRPRAGTEPQLSQTSHELEQNRSTLDTLRNLLYNPNNPRGTDPKKVGDDEL
ncbi:hypothetical protein C8R44DRAFT_728078 [Mycena epipterygia]|nr:hypothetical protein C8R44DRAFT_728078 [Mycena epipterygia]